MELGRCSAIAVDGSANAMTRWQGSASKGLAREVFERLLSGKPLDRLGLEVHGGRIDLRGIVAPLEELAWPGDIFDRAICCRRFHYSCCTRARRRSPRLAAYASVGLGEYRRPGFRDHPVSPRSSEARHLAAHSEHFSISLLVRVRILQCETEATGRLGAQAVRPVSGGIRAGRRNTHWANRTTA